MPVNRPPLLELGGEESFSSYKAAFDRLYSSGRVADVLGNRIEFPPSACRHVCFKPVAEDPYGRLPRQVWAQERAERIPWILLALSDIGTEVRPNVQRPDRLSYALIVEADPIAGLSQEYFGVVTEPTDPGEVLFVTAFPMEHSYWARWRRGGRRLYPPP